MLTGDMYYMAISNLNFLNMYAAGASSGNVSFGSGQQNQGFNPVENEEKNLFASSSVGGIKEGPSTSGTNPVGAASQSSMGLVDRLDRLDAGTLKPEHQDEFRANKLDLYA